ncbi:MAG: choice-of-anchor L domain-containing protein, partial [Winogradskyella sp.]
MKTILYLIFLLTSILGFSQDIIMEDGTFNRCAPDKFYDSGGEFGPYSNDENYTTTICPQNANEFIILSFTEFNTQLNQDVMTIYDGDDTTAPVIGTYSATTSPSTVSASAGNTSGCLTITFTSSSSGVVTGWEADILCATPCQDIVASIDSTVPTANGSGVISILPGDSVDFNASATFSVDGTDATYTWDFGDTNTATGANVTNTFATAGTYVVTLTVTDNNPQGCTDTETITVFVLGPNVVIDQDTYTSAQLIEDVLIDSPCASVTNITSSTGIDFNTSQPNGIGYFISNGIDFPFADGVLLASGDASEARGPNNINLSQGVGPVWPGDADLNTQFGITTNNASFIQFDFTPLGNNISFDFLMASEEYNGGSFECNYSDAFAFLLTDSNGVTTNLAVLPGTTTPILVTNIHLANTSCGAVNPQYFGGYTAANASPTAFDGRTTVFTAQSTVNPGEQYTIKLVIADASDSSQDSGVFLKAGSFNLGGDLGGDRTIDIGNAPCAGGVFTLDSGVDVPNAIHTWYFNGAVITGETGSVINVTQPGVYSAEFDIDGVCQGSAEPVTIEFKPSPTANNAPNLSVCSLTGFEEFNLSENDDDILAAQNPTDFVITYHLTEQDAIDNVGALPTNYTNVTNPQTIWGRIADNSQECFSTTSFELSGSSQPTITSVGDLQTCDDG